MPIAVVIPAYNEAATLSTIVRRTLEYIDHVVVVDDGSNDDTATQAATAGAVVLRQSKNQGKGAALWRGMCYVMNQGAKAIITLDADGQHCPEDIPRLVAAHKNQTDRVIIAARLKNRECAPPLRRFANQTADFWVSWAAGCPIQDSQSGFRLYPAALIRALPPPHGWRQGFVFESEALIEAAYHNFFPVAVSVKTIYPEIARSSHYLPWRDTSRIVVMVAGKLLKRGMYPIGLLRSLALIPIQRT